MTEDETEKAFMQWVQEQNPDHLPKSPDGGIILTVVRSWWLEGYNYAHKEALDQEQPIIEKVCKVCEKPFQVTLRNPIGGGNRRKDKEVCSDACRQKQYRLKNNKILRMKRKRKRKNNAKQIERIIENYAKNKKYLN